MSNFFVHVDYTNGASVKPICREGGLPGALLVTGYEPQILLRVQLAGNLAKQDPILLTRQLDLLVNKFLAELQGTVDQIVDLRDQHERELEARSLIPE